jgi:hypothetical protein
VAFKSHGRSFSGILRTHRYQVPGQWHVRGALSRHFSNTSEREGFTSPVSTVPNNRQGPGVSTSDVRMYTHLLGSESQVFSELRVRLLVCFTSAVQVPGRPTETQEVSMSFIRPITVNVVHPSGTTAQGLLLRDRQEHACDDRRDFTSHCGFFLRYCKVPWPGSQWTSNLRLSHR